MLEYFHVIHVIIFDSLMKRRGITKRMNIYRKKDCNFWSYNTVKFTHFHWHCVDNKTEWPLQSSRRSGNTLIFGPDRSQSKCVSKWRMIAYVTLSRGLDFPRCAVLERKRWQGHDSAHLQYCSQIPLLEIVSRLWHNLGHQKHQCNETIIPVLLKFV
jgi:hypothetical protein